MDFQNSYFEDEVRDGFYVPGIMKRAWGAEIKILYEIDRVCRKNNIKYFADFGTLLGAVRHNGFIPWDDDIDICMLREDYNRFLEVASKEFGNEYSVYNYRNNEDYWGFATRVVAQNKICFEKEHLDNFCQFPYIVGVDVFALDYISRDVQFEEMRSKKARILIEYADYIYENKLDTIKIRNVINIIEKNIGISIPENLIPLKSSDKYKFVELRVYLYEKAEEVFSFVSEDDSDYITKMMPNWLYNNSLKLNKKYYNESIYLPFENIEIPVPMDYDVLLKNRYGNYMKIVKDLGAHNYPFFQSQKDCLDVILKKESIKFLEEKKYSDYKLDRNLNELNDANAFKSIVKECLTDLREILKKINYEKNEDMLLNIFADFQQLLIDLGNYIEKVKGEETAVVLLIEKLCEEVYNVWYSLKNEKECTTGIIDVYFNELSNSISNEILNKDIVVFLPYKYEHWNTMKSEYRKEIEAGSDVYVIPIPYYYKNFEGEYISAACEINKFNNIINLKQYDEFDFDLMHPDRVYFNAVWDNENPVITVHPFFYAENLSKYTDRLIFINPFLIDDFSKENVREYYNMKYYCTMPGIIYADEVCVHSDVIKKAYIDKLVEFAGEETKEIWENKIKVTRYCKKDKLNIDILLNEARTFYEKVKNQDKKILLYYINIPSVIRYDEEDIILKITKIFKEIAVHTAIIVCMQKGAEKLLCKKESNLLERIRNLSSEYDSVLYLGENYDKNIADICDLYYGDISNMIQKFRNEKKTVICQNIVDDITLGNNLEFQAFVQVNEDTAYASCIDFNGLFKVNLKTDELEFVDIFPDEELNKTTIHCSAIYHKGSVYFVPAYGNSLHIYNIEKNEIISIKLPAIEQKNVLYKARYKFIDGRIIDNIFWLIPSTYSGILKINISEYSVMVIDDWIPGEGFFFRKTNIFKENELYIACRDNGFILKFNFQSEKGEIFRVKNACGFISAIEVDDKIVFAPTKDEDIVIWNTTNNVIKEIGGFSEKFVQGEIAFSKIIKKDNHLIFLPNMANMPVELDIETEKIICDTSERVIDKVVGDNIFKNDNEHIILYLYQTEKHYYFRYKSNNEENIFRISKGMEIIEKYKYNTEKVNIRYSNKIIECLKNNKQDVYYENKYFSLSEFVQLTK